jgi:Cytochrome c554 and c-prime
MMKLLGRKDAHEDNQCLSCHVHPQFDTVAAGAPKLFARDGVSCESCHGPGEKWLREHYKDSWKGYSFQEKRALGMRDVKTLSDRVRLCLDCHVGSPDANVNHDLIAAGHPRLNFEFSAFHSSWARHWPDARDKDPGQGGQTDFEIRAWVLGQRQTAQAALELLHSRTKDDRKPWLEFAEMDCFACHHELKSKSRRRQPDESKKADSIPWSRWYVAQLPSALSVSGNGEGAGIMKILDEIGQKMAAKESAEEIAKLAMDARGRLNRILPEDRRELPLQDLYQAILARERTNETRGWDAAAQAYLALAALHNTWTDRKNFAPAATLRRLLIERRTMLRFPDGFNSPRFYDPRANP